MKRIAINTVAALMASVLCMTAVQAQQVRVALKGDAYLIRNGKLAALEVGGKIVIGFDQEFAEIITSTGNYFAARYEEDDSDWYIYDRNGNEAELGGGSYGWSFDKVSMVAGIIVVEEKGKTYYFSENDLSTTIKPQAAGHDFFEKELEKKTGQPAFNPEKMAQSKASRQADSLSSLVRKDGRFEIRAKPNSNRQQIFVKGKMLHEAQEYKVVLDTEFWDKYGCWVMIAKNGGYYGAIIIEVYEEDGESHLDWGQLIPYKYTFGAHEVGNMMKLTRKGGVPDYFNTNGWRFSLDWRTGKFTPTHERWVHNEATDEWTLKKPEK